VISRRRVVVLLPALLVVSALAVSAAVWFRGTQDPPPIAQDRLGAVLLVPGRNADSSSLVDLQRRIFLTGRRAMIVSTGIEDGGDLRAQANEVQRAADRMLEAGAPSVDVVGYSAGGIVTRLWLAQGGADVVRRVVTIGTPNLGATGVQLNNLVTKRYCETTCAQLSPDSALLKSLPPARGPAPWVNLWTPRDRVVDPPSAQLPGALNVSLPTVCPQNRAGHISMPTDPLVVGIVLKALETAPLTAAPTEADCAGLLQAGAPAEIPGVASTP
jgi:triacylglycerol lipase